jgi:DNA-binding winged helix-turn-helix (wHTH) protein
MEKNYPTLAIFTPQGEEKTISFAPFYQENPQKTQILIGRLESNDICLPDPDQNISRQHCLIEFQQNTWIIRDKGSANGTFIQRAELDQEIDVRCHEFVPLKENDKILILAHFTPEDRPIFWIMVFHDPGVTQPKKGFQAPYTLEYSLSEQQLKRLNRYETEIINLTKQQSQLLHYMAQRNHENQQKPVLCTYRELIEAIWGDNFGHNSNEINRLIWGIRAKIESDSGEPQFLQSIRGQGYRLHIKIKE